MLRAQRDRHQVLQNKATAGLDLHGRGLHPVNLVKPQKGNLMFWSLCAVVIFPWRKHGKTGGLTLLMRGCLMCYLKFAEFFWSFSQVLPILKNLQGFVDLSEVLVDASEVGGALAVVVHDVAAQFPDGPLELVAVELELRKPAPDAVERVQQRVGLLPHALLHGRHHGFLWVEAVLLRRRLRVGGHERLHHPLVLQALAAAGLVVGAARVGGQAEGAGDRGGGGARGGSHA